MRERIAGATNLNLNPPVTQIPDEALQLKLQRPAARSRSEANPLHPTGHQKAARIDALTR